MIVTDRRSRMADQRSIYEQMAEIVGDLEQVAALTQEAADAETPADAVPNREMASLVRDANEMAALARAAEAGLLPEQDPSGQDPVDRPRPDPHNWPMQRQIQARSIEQVRSSRRAHRLAEHGPHLREEESQKIAQVQDRK